MTIMTQPTPKIPLKYTKALIYCRVSSKLQKTEGHGLESQEHRCRQYAQEKGYTVERVFADDYTGGGDFMKRPQMRALLEYLDEYPTKRYVIIFDDLKRFARDTVFHLKLRQELNVRQAKPECLNFNFEDSPEGAFVETILAAQNELEREQNRRQVIQKQKARLEAGYWAFCPPPGLRNVKHPVHGKLLTPVEPLAGIYKEAIEWYRDFKLLTLEDFRQCVRSRCAVQGIKCQLSIHGAQNILTNPLYAGYIEYKPWGVAFRKAQHEGFINFDTYQAVQARLANRAKPRLRKDYSEDFPARGYVLCPSCSKPMTASWHRGKSGERFPHYWCKQKGCPNYSKTARRAQLEGDLVRLFTQYTPRPAILSLSQAVLNDIWQNRAQLEAHQQQATTREVQAIDEKIDAFLDLIPKVQSDAVRSQYNQGIEKLVAQKAVLLQNAAQPRYTLEGLGTLADVVFDYIAKPAQQWKSGVYTKRRTLLAMYFERGVAYDRVSGFGTPDLPLLLKVTSQKAVSKHELVEMAGVEPA